MTENALYFRADDGISFREPWAVIFNIPGPPSLVVQGNGCPGPATIVLDNLTPDGRVALLFAFGPGVYFIPSGLPCAGTALALDEPSLLRVITADPTVAAVLDVNIPEFACGLSLQAIDAPTCEPTNVVEIPFF